MNARLQTLMKTAPKPSFTPVASGLLHRTCACGQHTGGGGECAECRKKREGTLQRAVVNAAPVSEVPPIVHDVLRSPGQPLDAATRAFMEPRFGHDFSRVRVHTDAKAAEAARAVNALAYTVGRDVVFGAGQYRPGTGEGRRLVAHELTHVVQQKTSTVDDMQRAAFSASSDASEQEADRVAQLVLFRRFPSITHIVGARVQRLGANPGCSAAQADTIHQAIFDARGWLNKAIPALEAPLSARVLASLRRNFGPTYGVAANASLIHDRLVAARRAIGTIPFSCATAPADATCAALHCGWANAGSNAATICSNVTLDAGTAWQFQAGCALHETFHATFSGMTAAHDFYSGWHGHAGATAGYPGAGIDPLLNADSYTTLVMDLS